MKLAISLEPTSSFAGEGVLKTGVRSEQDGPFPHMILEMSLIGLSETVKVGLDERDLSTIVRLARELKIEKLRAAVE